MIKLSVMYPHEQGSTFDMDYYLNKHLPLVQERWGAMGMTDAYIVKGVAGGAPDSPPSYQVMAQITFDSLESLQNALSTHGQELMGDIPNFSSVTPVIQISEFVS